MQRKASTADKVLEDLAHLITHMQHQYKERTYNDDDITFNDLYHEWIKSKTKLSAPSKYKYSFLFRLHISPAIGEKYVKEITAKDISDLIEEKRHVLASSTVKEMVCCVIRQCLKYAEGLGYVEKNVAKFVDIPTVEQDHGRALTNDEIISLRKEAYNHRLGIAVDLLLFTGMRKGELLALTWDDIDFDAQTLSVNKAFVSVCNELGRDHKGVLGPPKTKKSNRVIAMPSALKEALLAYKERESREGRDGRRFVLSQDKEDRPYNPANFNRLFHLWRNKADIGPEIHIHSLRHTYCTLMHEAGVDNYTLIQQTGHTDTRMLERVYLHKRSMKMQENAAKLYGEKMDQILTE